MDYQKRTKSFVQQLGSVGKPGNNNNTPTIILTENTSDRVASFVALLWSDALDERSDSSDDNSSSLLVLILLSLLVQLYLMAFFFLETLDMLWPLKKSRMHLQSYKYCNTFCKPSSEIFLDTWTLHQQTYFMNCKVSNLICHNFCSSWWILQHSEKEKRKLVGGKNPERNSIVLTHAQTRLAYLIQELDLLSSQQLDLSPFLLLGNFATQWKRKNKISWW